MFSSGPALMEIKRLKRRSKRKCSITTTITTITVTARTRMIGITEATM
jgi:hypothetical protein